MPFPFVAAAMLASTAASAYSSSKQNKANRAANDANIAENKINREWQETMSNTAYERSMADMRRAGLNPMLAYSKGGASTPPGGVPNIQPTVKNNYANAAIGAAQAAQQMQINSAQAVRAKHDAKAEAKYGKAAAEARLLTENPKTTAAILAKDGIAKVDKPGLLKFATRKAYDAQKKSQSNRIGKSRNFNLKKPSVKIGKPTTISIYSGKGKQSW